MMHRFTWAPIRKRARSSVRRTHATRLIARHQRSARARAQEKSLIREESSFGNRKQQTIRPRSLVKIVGEERPIKETSKALTPVSVRGLRAYQRAMVDRCYGVYGRLCMTNANIENARSNRRPIASIAASLFVLPPPSPLETPVQIRTPSRPTDTPRPLAALYRSLSPRNA